MDRWISTAWKAFWVGLGASAVLVGQAVLSPAAPPVQAPPAVIIQHPFAPEAAPAAENRVNRERIPALPVLSRVPHCSTDRCS